MNASSGDSDAKSLYSSSARGCEHDQTAILGEPKNTGNEENRKSAELRQGESRVCSPGILKSSEIKGIQML